MFYAWTRGLFDNWSILGATTQFQVVCVGFYFPIGGTHSSVYLSSRPLFTQELIL